MKVQHLAGLAAGISPALAFACKVTGCIFKNSAACFKSNVSKGSFFIHHHPMHFDTLWLFQSPDAYH